MNRFFGTILLLIALAGGCREQASQERTAPSSTPMPTTDQVVVDALVGLEIGDIKARMGIKPTENGALFPTDREGGTERVIEEILRLPNEETKNRRLAELVRQLLYEDRLDQASELVMKITDVPTRDRLLEDIVRFLLQNVYRLYRGPIPLMPDNQIPEAVLLPIHQAVDTAGKIDDPLIYAETIGSIVLFQGNLRDRSGVAEMMKDAVKTVLNRPGGGIRKTRALLLLADWFLRNNVKEPLEALAPAAEKALGDAPADFESATLLMEIAMIFFLLDDIPSLDKTARRVERVASEIDPLPQRVSILLRLAETLLLLTGKEKGEALSARTAKIKSLALNVDLLVHDPSYPTSKSSSGLRDGTATELPSGREAIAAKNRILRKVAAVQAWKSPLEDVWDTIEEMDHGPDRDAALTTTIEMMIATQTDEFAKDWAEEISDPEKKRSLLKRLDYR